VTLAHQVTAGIIDSPPGGMDECSEAVTAQRFNRSFFEPRVGCATVASE
jgi:hypothetical protein